jgi:hypothetical protein
MYRGGRSVSNGGRDSKGGRNGIVCVQGYGIDRKECASLGIGYIGEAVLRK